MVHKSGIGISVSLVPDIRHNNRVHSFTSNPTLPEYKNRPGNMPVQIEISLPACEYRFPTECRTHVPLSLQSLHSPTHPSVCALSTCTLPLLPAEVVPTAKHNKKAKDGEEDDGVSCHHQTTGTPLDCGLAGENNGEPKR